ncbi:MAG: type II toxin-antitoxin system death-on-curing family toxin [Flavobacteriales bacterium]
MINAARASRAHDLLIEAFGGATGLRDADGLDAALARAYQTFDGEDLHPTTVAKAAALLEAVIIRHPWVDGNKRTAYVLMELLLGDGGLRLEATEDDKYDLVIQVATGKLDVEGIVQWLVGRVVQQS